jgi:hypothetical protein
MFRTTALPTTLLGLALLGPALLAPTTAYAAGETCQGCPRPSSARRAPSW